MSLIKTFLKCFLATLLEVIFEASEIVFKSMLKRFGFTSGVMIALLYLLKG